MLKDMAFLITPVLKISLKMQFSLKSTKKVKYGRILELSELQGSNILVELNYEPEKSYSSLIKIYC